MKAYELTFADGYVMTRFAIDLDEVISYLDKDVQKHGDCKECMERIRYDRYTGPEYKKIW